jgi:hypothetical protein
MAICRKKFQSGPRAIDQSHCLHCSKCASIAAGLLKHFVEAIGHLPFCGIRPLAHTGSACQGACCRVQTVQRRCSSGPPFLQLTNESPSSGARAMCPAISRPMSYLPVTRTVDITRDPRDPWRPWVAVEHRTRVPVLRLAHDQLVEICARFGWRIVTQSPVDAVTM